MNTESLEQVANAAADIVAAMRSFAEAGSNIVLEVLQGVPFVELEHYPPGDICDPGNGSQYYFHAHPPARPSYSDFGHFHLFLHPERADGVDGAGAATMAIPPSATAEPRTSMDFLSVRIVCSSDYVCAAAHRTGRTSAVSRHDVVRHKHSSGCTMTGHSRVKSGRRALPRYASPPVARRRGCLMMNSLVEISGRDADVSRIVDRHFRLVERSLRRAVDEAKSRGEVAPGIATVDAARTLLALAHGVLSLGKSEFGRPVARTAIQTVLDQLANEH